VDVLKKLCADDVAAMDAIDAALRTRRGPRTELLDNVKELPAYPTGNSRDRSLRKLRTEAARSEEVRAVYERVLARLFVECGWTQERIAGKMGQTQSWVCYRLRFGRFLRIITRCDNSSSLPNLLTEGRFRKAWTATHKDRHPKETEAERFGRVLKPNLIPDHCK
jgi:hypothetical protein